MVVECKSCRTRFRLNVSLLKGSKAVRFRCRRCGGSIMVRNPDAPTVVPVSTAPAKIAASPVTADISSVVRPEIEQSTPHETPVPPPHTHDLTKAIPTPPVHPIPTGSRLEALVDFSPVEAVIPSKASTRRKRSIRRKPSSGRTISVLGLSILLLTGVVLFGTTEVGLELLGKWFPSWVSASQSGVAARPAYDVREMKSTAHGKAVAGNLFVVSGTVVNIGRETSHGILMRAALLGADNQVLMENSSLAGNLIDEPTLLHMGRNSIDGYLKMEHREEEERDLLPGKSLPFMVVFFDPPEKTGFFTVHAVDAE